MCRGESHFSQKLPLANVSECIESGENGWRMSGECIESGENGWQMSGECIESGQSRVANVGECDGVESDIFSKMVILASTRIQQIRRRVAIA